MSEVEVQFVANDHGDVTGVIVPIALWREVMAELETHHLLKSEAMKARLLEARAHTGGLDLGEVLGQLGLGDAETG